MEHEALRWNKYTHCLLMGKPEGREQLGKWRSNIVMEKTP
jgi:hypothetical protein